MGDISRKGDLQVQLVDQINQYPTVVNSDGSLDVNSTFDPSIMVTYSAAILNIASAALATDFFTIFGSATKSVKILRIGISGTQGTAGDVTIALIKRSSTNTGGTSSAVIAVPHEAGDPVATATVLVYTANPTALGTSVGNVRTTKIFIPPTNANAGASVILFDFGASFGKPIVLSGVSQGLCINLNGVTLATSAFDIWIEWIEE